MARQQELKLFELKDAAQHLEGLDLPNKELTLQKKIAGSNAERLRLKLSPDL